MLERRHIPQSRSHVRTRMDAAGDEGAALFTNADGRPVRPEYLSHQSRKLIMALDLPPIRLHDLISGASRHSIAW